jgi:hypothetical protein
MTAAQALMLHLPPLDKVVLVTIMTATKSTPPLQTYVGRRQLIHPQGNLWPKIPTSGYTSSTPHTYQLRFRQREQGERDCGVE